MSTTPTLFGTTPAPVVSDALISDCGRYRYWLTRTWDASLPVICWLMLNPSTADASDDDPTIRKCMKFSRRWGAGGIAVVNLFAYRATDPDILRKVFHPIAQPTDPVPFHANANDAWIIRQSDGRRLIAAWGRGGRLAGRNKQVMELLASRRVECLKLTNDGQPWHPLYVRDDTEPVVFSSPAPTEGGIAR